MSFILDALRKSDARRRMGQSPELGQAQPPANGGSARSGKRGRRLAVLFSVALVLTVVVVASRHDGLATRVQQWVGPEPAVEPREEELERAAVASIESQARASAEAADPAPDALEEALPRERMITDPATIETELARLLAEQTGEAREEQPSRPQPSELAREPRRTPTPRTAVTAEAPQRSQARPAVDPEDAERVERLMQARQARLAEAAGRETPAERAERTADARDAGGETGAVERTAPVMAEPWSPGGPEYVRVWELPLSIRRNLPDLRLTIHVFAPEEDRRFVLVNGERYVAGDMITKQVRLVDIRREGAVVDFRDYRFLLEP